MKKIHRHLIAAFAAIVCLAGAAHTQAQTYSAVMSASELQFTENPDFTFPWPGTGGIGFVMLFGDPSRGAFGVTLNADYTWTGTGPSNGTSLFAGERPFVINPGAGMDTWVLGTLRVGMNYGGRDLYVQGVIHQGPEESPVPRWRGENSSEPSDPSGGDQYFDTTTSKARLWTGSQWIDLN